MFASPQAPPSLQVVSRAPFVVSGAHFKPAERVILKSGAVNVVVRTTRAGTFRANLAGAPADRCSLNVVATGARGDRAILPARTMCAPAMPGSTA